MHYDFSDDPIVDIYYSASGVYCSGQASTKGNILIKRILYFHYNIGVTFLLGKHGLEIRKS